MAKLTWRVSYETFKFDTPDGELHKDQYAKYGDVYLIRNHPENNNQPTIIDPREDLDWQTKIAGLTEVNILENEKMYFEEFLLPNNRIFRQNITKNKFIKTFTKIPEKEISNAEIANIVKDDSKWR